MGKRSGRWTLALVLALACVFSLTSVSVMALQSGDGSGDSATAESSASADGVGSLASAAAAAISDDADAAGDGTASAEAVADGASSLTAAAEAYEAELETAAVSEDGADAEADGSELAVADAAAANAAAAADDDATSVAGGDAAAAADDSDVTLDTAADDEVTSITIECTDTERLLTSGSYEGQILVAKGDVLHFAAYDQDGNQLDDVNWSMTNTSASSLTMDSSNGELTVIADFVYSSTAKPTITATSETYGVSASTAFTLRGYAFASSSQDPTVTLASDGSGTSKSLTGGVNGYNSWSYDEEAAEGVAEVTTDLSSTSTSFKFTAYRPGSFDVTVTVNGSITDTTTVTVKGVAVEDEDGELANTYIDVGEGSTDLTEQLTAYVGGGVTLTGWSSSDESVATVDENGLVTAVGDIGSTVITATDSDGNTGSINVVCYDDSTPWMKNIAFSTSSLTWANGETYKIDQYDYQLTSSTTSVGAITVGADTAYDEEKFTVTYSYIDADGEEQAGTINNGAATELSNIGYGDTVITFTVTSIDDPTLKTEYVFTVTRSPSKTSASTYRILGNSGLAINPGSRDLLESEYEGEVEGTFFQASSDGSLTGKTTVSATVYYYWTYLQRYEDSFTLDVDTSNDYAYARYSIDGGETWTELGQGGGTTDLIEFADDEDVIEVQVQVINYYYYHANLEAGLDGFGDTSNCTNTYTVWVERVLTEYSGSASESASDAYMLSAATEDGTWYREFDSERTEYTIVADYGTESTTLEYTITEDAVASIDGVVQKPDSDGVYTTTLSSGEIEYEGTTDSTTIKVTSEGGQYTESYTFSLYTEYSENVPDAVVDYLCIGSQYTNSTTQIYGEYPEQTLAGVIKSLGNFGGYITYYFEDALVDDPDNEYGVDLYIYGNAYEQNRSSFSEPGQVYVSEDGVTWYALAGSEHYEDTTIWDYTITYTRTDEDGAWWTDNLGNVIDTSVNYYSNTSYPTSWPSSEYYYLGNTVSEDDEYTYTGILLMAEDGTVTGDGSSGANAGFGDFGYVDCYSVGTVGASTNPYTATESNNGFDLAWAVDDDGNPVDVSDMEFHYVKVATASNIWADVLNEKSTEVQYIVRADSTGSAVGETDTPDSVTITCGDEVETVELEEGTSVYEVEVGATGEASVLVNGTSADDAIWVNNQNVDSGTAATGFEVTSDGEELVRVIVQNGEKEPSIVLLRISGSAE